MDDDSTPKEDLFQEREALMVFPPENSKKSHLLKPCSTSIDGSGAFLRQQNRPDLKALSRSVNFIGWRLASRKFKSWTRKMAALHKPIWEKAGTFEAVMSSIYRITTYKHLVLGITEKWCPDSKNFVFPWGETSITLEDVMVLLGFSVSGLPVFAALDRSGEKIKSELLKEWVEIRSKTEHAAFLVCWLSYFVFPLRYYHIFEAVFSIAIHLSSGTKIALAPAVLPHLYQELTRLKYHIQAFRKPTITVVTDFTALFKLVQVWTWERFKELQPIPNQLLEGEPRLALWHEKQRKIDDVRWVLDNSKIDNFEWRPFTKPVKNWEFPRFYPEKAMLVPVGPNLDDEFTPFARFIKVSELVGIYNVEHYFPDRVASQFGLLQDVPCLVNRNNLLKEEAWDHYNKPIDDLTLRIPSRYAVACVTPMFCEWGKKTFQEFQSSSEMNRTSEAVRKISKDSRRKRRKYMILSCHKKQKCMKQSRRENDDVSLTIAQMLRHNKKKYSDVEHSGGDDSEQLGKKSRLEADNNDSGPNQKLASISADGNEAVPLLEIEHRNEETDETGLSPIDETNSSDSFLGANGVEIVVSPPETVQTCDDELDVYGSNADMVEEQTFLLQKDGSVAEEKVRSDEKLCSEAEKEDDVVENERLVQEKVALEEEEDLALKADNNGPTLREDDESYEKMRHELEVLVSSIEARTDKAERNLAWLQERRAIRQWKIAAARLI
ncbi:unnamed protein product [Arabis nemorensis]|uniref:Aminotransferase-like plant mobile domain-containing protein n=1 Tax=Arabis nemorensis TaxID=586526 RepID=A0A565BGN5_9BRAS|nr:unnamed protein product [Arabis nemorensis]